LDVSVSEIQFFNPSFKRNEIPHITGRTNFLRLPKNKIAIFTSNEDKIYAYLNHQESKRERPNDRLASVKRNDSTNTSYKEKEFVTRTKFHRVRKGDSLNEIANQYNVSVANLKKWNHLRSSYAPKGRRLKIVTTERIEYKETKEIVADTSVKQTLETKDKVKAVASSEPKLEKVFKTEKVVTNKEVTKTHKVKSGDNLGVIASKYDVSVAELKKWNKLKGDNIGLGDKIKIIKTEKVTSIVRKEIKQPIAERKEEIAAVDHKAPKTEKGKKEEKTETTSKSENYYVVAKGDNLYIIAKKNNISVANLREWNTIIDNNVKVGSQLIVSNVSLAESKEEEKPKTELKNVEHVVEKGEYLGTIARKYNVTINNLLEWNSLSDTNIKLGDKLIVGKEEVSNDKVKISSKEAYASKDKKVKESLYRVRKGDTLLKITQKFPGITIADIKKWNNIKGESIKPGMKLKING
jgi:membrane-bound lytic murein transglycosylase D